MPDFPLVLLLCELLGKRMLYTASSNYFDQHFMGEGVSQQFVLIWVCPEAAVDGASCLFAVGRYLQ